MKIRILSDLHQEFGDFDIPKNQNVDLIILAGDINTKQNALNWIREFSGAIPTVLICGNHEFYGGQLPRVTEKLKERTLNSNIHVLENESFSIGGWQVFGCTLWTDMDLYGDWQDGCSLANEMMNDYKRIRNSNRGFRQLRARDTREIHLNSVLKMEQFFKRNDPQKTIVVTHHAPSRLSLPEQRRDKSISCAYASNLDEFILKHQPPLWIHGHIHHSNDYQLGKTRIVTNPLAYPDDYNPEFDPELVIEL